MSPTTTAIRQPARRGRPCGRGVKRWQGEAVARVVRDAVLAPVAVDRSPSPPRSWAKTAGSPHVHLSDARDRRDGLRQARV